MLALITGASSGIGRDMARILSKMGYELILVARRKERLEELKKELGTPVQVIALDLKVRSNCYKLYDKVKNKKIDVLINNAGFGLFGEFSKTDLDTELDMIDLNIVQYHILTKLFLQDFVKRDRGFILNVCSSAGFMAGPRMATYYATKNYVVSLTSAIYEELKKDGSNVSVSLLCPGPVNTEFNKVARVHFSIKGLESMDVARYAIKKMFDEKLIIIPGLKMKLGVFFTRFVPRKLLLKISYKIQNGKRS